MSSTGGRGYAPYPGGLGPTPNITGEQPPAEVPPPGGGAPVMLGGVDVAGLQPEADAPALSSGPGTVVDEDVPTAQQYVALANGLPSPAAAPTALQATPPNAPPLLTGSVGVHSSRAPDGSVTLPGTGGLREGLRRGEAATRAEIEAIKQKADVDKAQATETADVLSHGLDQQRALEAKEAAQQQQLHDDLQTRQKGMDDFLAQVNSKPFDPDHYMHSMDAGQRVMTGISVALGAFSQAFGGQNVGLNMLNSAIERDVQAQKENYDRGMQQHRAMETAYGRARQMGMDDAQATRLAIANKWDTTQKAVQVVASKYAPQGIEAGKAALIAHAKQQGAKAYTEAQQALHNAALADQHLNIAQQNLGIQRENADAKLSMANAKMDAAGKKYSIGGWDGQGGSPEAYNDARKSVAQEKILVRKLDEMKTYANGAILGKSSPSEMAKVSSTAQQVKVALKENYHLGVMSKSDEELLDKVAGDPSNFSWTPASVARFDHLIEQVQQDTDDTMEASGYKRTSALPSTQLVHESEAAGGRG